MTKYSLEPQDKGGYTAENDRLYSRFAAVYDLTVKRLPIWLRWISQVLPYVQGPRVLEVSFGTGALLNEYAPDLEVVGLEYNWQMIAVARRNLEQDGRSASLQQGDVNHLPFRSGAFDSVVATMAFTGYPDGRAAMAELSRVLRPGGRLLMIDVNYPQDRNPLGMLLVKLWMNLGDIVRDMRPLFQAAGFEVRDEEIGGWGSVHLYVATKVASRHSLPSRRRGRE